VVCELRGLDGALAIEPELVIDARGVSALAFDPRGFAFDERGLALAAGENTRRRGLDVTELRRNESLKS
jgi:hypothetical protein